MFYLFRPNLKDEKENILVELALTNHYATNHTQTS